MTAQIDRAEGPQSDATGAEVVNHYFTTRWSQKGNSETVTGKRRYQDRAEVMALCREVNAKWGGEIEQWCVRWKLDAEGTPKEVRQYYVR